MNETPTYDAVFDRVCREIADQEAHIEEDQEAAPFLVAELIALEVPERRFLLVTNSSRFHNPFLCEALIEQARESAFQDTRRSFEMARLAVAVAERLREASCRSPEIRDGLRARAIAQLANALRLEGRHTEAEEAFLPVEDLLRQEGRLGLLDTARLLDLRASLHRDRRQFDPAGLLLDQVIAIYQGLGQWNLLGRALMQRSAILGETGQLDAEIRMLRRALDLIDPQEEPRSFLVARYNLIVSLNQAGRSREAFALLFHTRPLFLKLGDRLSLLRLRWLEGLVASGLGRLEQAAVAFREVRDAYLDLSLEYDAAMVALDLIAVCLRRGRIREIRGILQEILDVFCARDIHREAEKALSYLQGAVCLDEAGLTLVEEVAAFLKEARTNPDLRFTPRVAPPS